MILPGPRRHSSPRTTRDGRSTRSPNVRSLRFCVHRAGCSRRVRDTSLFSARHCTTTDPGRVVMFPAGNELVANTCNLPVPFSLSFQVDNEVIRGLARHCVFNAKTGALMHWLIWLAPSLPVSCLRASRHAPRVSSQSAQFGFEYFTYDRSIRKTGVRIPSRIVGLITKSSIPRRLPRTQQRLLFFICRVITSTWTTPLNSPARQPAEHRVLWSRVSGVNTPYEASAATLVGSISRQHMWRMGPTRPAKPFESRSRASGL